MIRGTLGASHYQADAAFFRGFPPFSLYKLGLYLEQSFKFAVLRSLNHLFFHGFVEFSDYQYSGS
jgi:hypothetical protein